MVFRILRESLSLCKALGLKLRDTSDDTYQELEVIGIVQTVVAEACNVEYINNPFCSVTVDKVYETATQDSVKQAYFMYIHALRTDTEAVWNRINDFGFKVFNGVNLREFTSAYDGLASEHIKKANLQRFVSFALNKAFGDLIDEDPIVSIAMKIEKLTKSDMTDELVCGCNLVTSAKTILRLLGGETVDYTDCVPGTAEVEVYYNGDV